MPRADLQVNGKLIDATEYESLTPTADLPGRFFYRTQLLPAYATQDKTSVAPAAKDLVSGRSVKLDKPPTLAPMRTVIFDLAALGNPGVHDVTP